MEGQTGEGLAFGHRSTGIFTEALVGSTQERQNKGEIAMNAHTPGQTENASGTLTTGFDPNRKPPSDADMSFIDPPNCEEPEEDRLPLMGWLLPCAVLGALLLAWGVWG